MKWLALLAIACNGAPAPPAPAPIADDAKWRCATDADCMVSCSQGAVNKAWYATANVHECDDGCANQLAAAPRCVEHACVAFRESADGKTVTRNDSCTHRP